jgi:hypothetical protein
MSLPDYFIVKDVSIAYEDNTLVSDSQSLKRLVRSRTGQRWRITMELMLMPEDSLAGFAWLNKRKAQAFALSVPGWTGRGPSNALIAVGNTPGNGALQLTSATGITAGMFLQAPGSTKVYQVDNVTGNTVGIIPDLLTTVTTGQQITVAGATFTVFIANDIPEMRQASLRDPSLLSIEFVEAIP